jgi:histone-lysine N-methyltransferase SETMAR
MDFIRQPPTILAVAWLYYNEAPKQFAEPKLHQKKVMVTVWWSAAGVIHYNFLNPGETIIAENIVEKLTKCTESYSKNNQQWSIEKD